jgi:hypothetical protein
MLLDLSKIPLKEERVIRNAFVRLQGIKPVFPAAPAGQDVNKRITEMQGVLKRYWPDLQRYFDLRLLELCMPDLEESLLLKPQTGPGTPISDAVFNLFPPAKIRQMRSKRLHPPQHSARGVWDDCIIVIVDELRKAGYSGKKSYIETAHLLNLAFPKNYKTANPDLIRGRYTYHKITK